MDPACVDGYWSASDDENDDTNTTSHNHLFWFKVKGQKTEYSSQVSDLGSSGDEDNDEDDESENENEDENDEVDSDDESDTEEDVGEDAGADEDGMATNAASATDSVGLLIGPIDTDDGNADDADFDHMIESVMRGRSVLIPDEYAADQVMDLRLVAVLTDFSSMVSSATTGSETEPLKVDDLPKLDAYDLALVVYSAAHSNLQIPVATIHAALSVLDAATMPEEVSAWTDAQGRRCFLPSAQRILALALPNHEVLQVLLQDGRFPPCPDLLVAAVAAGATDAVRVLLADPRVDPCGLQSKALRCAVASSAGLASAAHLLADPRVDPRAYDNAAIMAAIAANNVSAVQLLLADGRADPAARQGAGIRLAMFRDFFEVVYVLLSDPRVDPTAVRVLETAIKTCSTRMVAAVLTHPTVDPNLPVRGSGNGHPVSPLELAIGRGPNCATLFLQDPRVDTSVLERCADLSGVATFVAAIGFEHPRLTPTTRLLYGVLTGDVELASTLLASPDVDPAKCPNLLRAALRDVDTARLVLKDPRVVVSSPWDLLYAACIKLENWVPLTALLLDDPRFTTVPAQPEDSLAVHGVLIRVVRDVDLLRRAITLPALQVAIAKKFGTALLEALQPHNFEGLALLLGAEFVPAPKAARAIAKCATYLCEEYVHLEEEDMHPEVFLGMVLRDPRAAIADPLALLAHVYKQPCMVRVLLQAFPDMKVKSLFLRAVAKGLVDSVQVMLDAPGCVGPKLAHRALRMAAAGSKLDMLRVLLRDPRIQSAVADFDNAALAAAVSGILAKPARASRGIEAARLLLEASPAVACSALVVDTALADLSRTSRDADKTNAMFAALLGLHPDREWSSVQPLGAHLCEYKYPDVVVE